MANRQIKGQKKLKVTEESEEVIHRTKTNYQSTFPIVGMGGSAGSFLLRSQTGHDFTLYKKIQSLEGSSGALLFISFQTMFTM